MHDNTIWLWLISTLHTCTLPAWIVLAAIGYSPTGITSPICSAEDLNNYSGQCFLPVALFTTLWLAPITFLMFVIIYIFWPAFQLLSYGAVALNLAGCAAGGISCGSDNVFFNVIFSGLVGTFFGFMLAPICMGWIDRVCGVKKGFSVFTDAWNIMGSAWLATKAAKVGIDIIKRI